MIDRKTRAKATEYLIENDKSDIHFAKLKIDNAWDEYIAKMRNIPEGMFDSVINDIKTKIESKHDVAIDHEGTDVSIATNTDYLWLNSWEKGDYEIETNGKGELLVGLIQHMRD